MADDDYCYLTTTGRRSGRPHEIEIWYASATNGPTLYLLAGARDSSDWVQNLATDPTCTVRMGTREAPARGARGRILTATDAEDPIGRALVFDKYQPRQGGDLSSWRQRSLAVALDLDDA